MVLKKILKDKDIPIMDKIFCKYYFTPQGVYSFVFQGKSACLYYETDPIYELIAKKKFITDIDFKNPFNTEVIKKWLVKQVKEHFSRRSVDPGTSKTER
jgi:hypothetical protein